MASHPGQPVLRVTPWQQLLLALIFALGALGTSVRPSLAAAAGATWAGADQARRGPMHTGDPVERHAEEVWELEEERVSTERDPVDEPALLLSNPRSSAAIDGALHRLDAHWQVPGRLAAPAHPARGPPHD